jgi:hypothetical protein
MGPSLDGGNQRNANVGDVFQDLYSFVVNLAPNAGIGDVAERGKIDIGNEVPACSSQDYDLVPPILRDPVKSVDKLVLIVT